MRINTFRNTSNSALSQTGHSKLTSIQHCPQNCADVGVIPMLTSIHEMVNALGPLCKLDKRSGAQDFDGYNFPTKQEITSARENT